MKRNRESKCRMKIIQELHLDKGSQQFLDEHFAKTNKRYATAYAEFRSGKTAFWFALIGMRLMATMSYKAGASISQATEAIKRLAESARDAINT